MTDFNSFFEENQSSGGAPSFKFGKIGSGVRGTVVSQKAAFVTQMGKQDPKLDKNGNKQPQLNVVLQTELSDWKNVSKIPKDQEGNDLPASQDDGKRAIYIKHRMIEAVGNAVREANVKALAIGGTLAVKKTGEIPTAFENGIPEYAAQYAPPSASDGFFGGDKAEEAAPAAKAAPAEEPADDDEPPF